jgi:hypothetical protein
VDLIKPYESVILITQCLSYYYEYCGVNANIRRFGISFDVYTAVIIKIAVLPVVLQYDFGGPIPLFRNIILRPP